MTETIRKVGVSRVRGVAVGRAVLWGADPAPRTMAGTRVEERARLARGIATARRGVLGLMRLLPRAEAELFEPELMILDELSTTLNERLLPGMRAEDVIEGSMVDATVDLLMDARARVLDAIAHSDRSVEEHLEGSDGEIILVTETLIPSVVASLPARVVGIVASPSRSGEPGPLSTSHSEILAREREITVAFLGSPDLALIREGDVVVLDTTEDDAVVAIAPSAGFTREALARRHASLHARAEADAEATEPLRQLGVGVLVNVGSLYDRIPPSAEGIGLLRTELVFSGHSVAPSEAEQFGVVCAIASLCPRAPAVVRLFDAGDDKPLPWLAPLRGEEAARGIELLLRHPEVLRVQLRALERVADRVDLRILVPYVRGPEDITRVRAGTRQGIAIGALVETVEAVGGIDAIASVSDFVSIGTNDLAASVTGTARASAGLSLDVRLLEAIARVVGACRARSRPVSVCGELAGDPHGARALIGLGVESISVAPARVAPVKRSLRGVSIDDCRAIARAAMTP